MLNVCVIRAREFIICIVWQ